MKILLILTFVTIPMCLKADPWWEVRWQFSIRGCEQDDINAFVQMNKAMGWKAPGVRG